MEKVALRKFSLSEYEVLATLGTGSFGRVRLVRHRKTGAFSALKMLKKEDVMRAKQTDHVFNETTILNRLVHPFTIRMEGFSQDSRYLYMLLEFVPGGELFTYLRTVGMLDATHAAFYTGQVVLAFEHMHSQNIIYRDLKPENLLLCEDGYLKITDFGFAKVVENRTFTVCGTPEYLAPQILLNQGHGKPADWWTLGILLYEMIAGIDPFTDEDPMNIYHNILKCKLKFPKSFDKEAKSLVRHLLVADLSKRFGNMHNGVSAIKEHRFFQGLDWQELLAKKVFAPYQPTIKKPGDTSNFSNYPDSLVQPAPLKSSEDPFECW